MKPLDRSISAKATLGFALSFGILVSAAAQPENILENVHRDVRNDGMAEKLRLIEKAYDSGDYDLALSLSESIKYTVELQKQLESDIGEPQTGSDSFGRTASLPPAWAKWARGWPHFKTIDVSETAGFDRTAEPVDLIAAFREDKTTDLGREIRVARVDSETGVLVEIPSQVYGEVLRGQDRLCHLVFFADVPANGAATYLVFYGNSAAERPDYATDLNIEGEGFDLDISTKHYTASLSEQTGQMERLRYAREHGLELFAGGKGHGEPPTIDWSNDYVDEDNFQKLRIRNWADPPNYEVVRGPLCVRVRRWGFPHSPVHPLFAPSRMHVDQTYIFYAGKDYFMKEGTMSAAKDFDFSTMRDDEWVLSGYSFTDPVWINQEGKLREGTVPSEHSNSIWGSGFYHRESRDAFIGVWLEHRAEKVEGDLHRNGGPIMHYHQHGQLWSRSPMGGGDLHFKEGASILNRNAYLLAPYPEENPAEAIEGTLSRLRERLQIGEGEPPVVEAPVAIGALAREGETVEAALFKNEIWEALRDVWDEQLYQVDANVVDMGYIYDVKVSDGVANILMTMPHKGRPVYNYLVFRGGGHNNDGIRERLLEIEGIDEVLVEFTWNPPWTVSRLTAAGRRSMGFKGPNVKTLVPMSVSPANP